MVYAGTAAENSQTLSVLVYAPTKPVGLSVERKRGTIKTANYSALDAMAEKVHKKHKATGLTAVVRLALLGVMFVEARVPSVLHRKLLGAIVSSVDDGDVAVALRAHGATTALDIAVACVEHLNDATDQAEHLPTKFTGGLYC